MDSLPGTPPWRDLRRKAPGVAGASKRPESFSRVGQLRIKNTEKKREKYFRLVVAHARRHAAHSTHTAHATRGHTLGCMALGGCNDIVNTQDHDGCFCC